MDVRNVMESAHLGTPRSSQLMLRYIGGYYWMRRVDGELVVVPLPAVVEITPFRPPLCETLASSSYVCAVAL